MFDETDPTPTSGTSYERDERRPAAAIRLLLRPHLLESEPPLRSGLGEQRFHFPTDLVSGQRFIDRDVRPGEGLVLRYRSDQLQLVG
jgi:hypothetical protein